MEKLERKLKELPSAPGVYLFKDEAGEVIYVGKSANVRARVRSYFSGTSTNPVREKLRGEIADIKAEETPSEIAALVREAELIKKLKPRFNVLMRDSKNYVYVGFTREDFPRIIVSHQPSERLRANWMGPFTDARAVKKTLRLLRTIFPYYTKKKHSRVARQIGIVPPEDISEQAYRQNIRAVRNVLSGRSGQVQEFLKSQIQKTSEKKEYEHAKELRDKLEDLITVVEHAHVLGSRIATPPVFADTEPNWKGLGLQEAPGRIEAYDISNIQGKEAVGSMIVFARNEKGAYQPAKSEYRKFNIKTVEGANDPAMMQEIVARRMHHTEWDFPDLVVIDGGKAQLNAAHKILTEYDISTIALAKRSSSAKATADKKERVYFPDRQNPVEAERLGSETKKMLQALRDETHRFAIQFHRKKRNAAFFKE